MSKKSDKNICQSDRIIHYKTILYCHLHLLSLKLWLASIGILLGLRSLLISVSNWDKISSHMDRLLSRCGLTVLGLTQKLFSLFSLKQQYLQINSDIKRSYCTISGQYFVLVNQFTQLLIFHEFGQNEIFQKFPRFDDFGKFKVRNRTHQQTSKSTST